MVCVFKVNPQPQGQAIKSLVNIYVLSDEHFEDQAIQLKKLFYAYKARRLVIDGNGVGLGLVDYMVKQQVDTETGDIIADFGVYNDDEGYYKKYRTKECQQDAIYIIKANAGINTEVHTNLRDQLSSGRVKLLKDDREARNSLLATKKGQAMTPEERNTYLIPFKLTTILKEELLNLREETEGINVILKPSNRAIKKDKVSALEYGLYYIKLEEDSKKKKKKFSAKDFCFMN